MDLEIISVNHFMPTHVKYTYDGKVDSILVHVDYSNSQVIVPGLDEMEKDLAEKLQSAIYEYMQKAIDTLPDEEYQTEDDLEVIADVYEGFEKEDIDA